MTPRIEAIKEAFRGCGSVPEVDACARDHEEEVKALDADPATRVMAIQIRNLAAYRRHVLYHHGRS